MKILVHAEIKVLPRGRGKSEYCHPDCQYHKDPPHRLSQCELFNEFLEINPNIIEYYRCPQCRKARRV